MLRRAPTSISLGQEDLEQYEQRRQQRLLEQQNSRAATASFDGSEKARDQGDASSRGARSKDQRIMGTG